MLLLWIRHKIKAERQARHLPSLRVIHEDSIQRPGDTLQGNMELLDATPGGTFRVCQFRLRLKGILTNRRSPELDPDQNLASMAQEIDQSLPSPPEAAMWPVDGLRGELEPQLTLLRSQLERMTTQQL